MSVPASLPTWAFAVVVLVGFPVLAWATAIVVGSAYVFCLAMLTANDKREGPQ